MELAGVIPTVITPWRTDETLDEEAYRRELRYMISTGASGLCVGGSTGEGFSLSRDELVRISAIAVEEADGRIPVVAGIIKDSTRDVIEYALAVKDTGVAALQITPVHYLYHSGPDSVLQYYGDIGQAAELPLIVYNVVRWNMLEPSTLVALDDVDWVVGVKQSAGDIHKVGDLMRTLRHERRALRVFSAVDALLYPTFVMGVHGSIAGISAVVPALVVQLWNATRSGDHRRALALHEDLLAIWRAVEGPEAPGRIRAALKLMGRGDFAPRRPLMPATDEAAYNVAKALDEAGLIDSRGASATSAESLAL